ncbi:hypothetical protein ACFVTE_18325 [Arthrobacter sp. NPDC058097]|uniref:hypothetical protein n=1 Tax=Arthrobacter sp. NPDC058097 TaxID=3346340 RepID=UPI0036D977D4
MRRTVGWLTAALVMTLVFGTVYVALQQLGRSAANEASEAALATQVQLPQPTPAPGPRLELTPDSGVFVIVYGADDRPEPGTVTLDGSLPVVPGGVLDAARTSGFNAVTWQPAPELRMAIVARPSAGKVVVAGQSLTPYEDRDTRTMIILALGWICSIFVVAAGYGTSEFLRRKPRPAA